VAALVEGAFRDDDENLFPMERSSMVLSRSGCDSRENTGRQLLVHGVRYLCRHSLSMLSDHSFASAKDWRWSNILGRSLRTRRLHRDP